MPGLRGRYLAVLTCLLLAACSEDRKEANDLSDTGVEPADSTNIGADAARTKCTVEVTKLKSRPGLPLAYLAAGAGDAQLSNKRARFVIRSGAEGVALYGSTGGHLVDASANGGLKTLFSDGLREFIIAVEGHVVRPESMTLEPTSDCRASVVVRGPLVPFPVLSEALGLALPPFEVEHRYTLVGDSAALEIATTVRLKAGAKPESALVTDAFFWSGDVQLYLPGHPEDDLPVAASTDSFAVTPNRPETSALAYAVVAEKKLNMVNAGGILGFLQPTLQPTAKGVTVKRWFAVGTAPRFDVASALAAARKAAQGTLKGGIVEGVVENAFGNSVVDALDKDGKPLARCGVDSDDKYACWLPEETRKLRPGLIGDGNGDSGGAHQHDELLARPTKVGKDPVTLLLQTMRPAKIVVKAREGTGVTAFRLTLRPVGGKPKGKRRTLVDLNGDATFLVPEGKYDAWVHHGPFYSRHYEQIDVKEQKTVTIEADLRQVVDTGAWRSADLHVHGEHSTDSSITVRHRIAAAIAEDLHYVVATDHDHLTDYAHWTETNLKPRIVTAVGVEASTIAYGHFNAWPLPTNPKIAGNGAPKWGGLGPEKLLDLFFGGDPKRIVQCNHPRYSGAGYFDAIGLDPKQTDPKKQVAKKLLRCTAVEVINGIAHKDTPKVLADWMALLNRGIRMTATGTSDCHGRHDFLGNPRTLVRIAGKPAHEVGGSPAQFDDGIRAGRAIASAGPFLTIEASDGQKNAKIGDVLPKPAGTATVTAKLRAPDWMPLGRLVVYRNGEKVFDKKVDTKPDKNGLQSFDAVGLPSAASSSGEDEWWVAVHEPGPKSAEPGIHRPPWAVTNPVFIDGTGDGKWKQK